MVEIWHKELESLYNEMVSWRILLSIVTSYVEMEKNLFIM